MKAKNILVTGGNSGIGYALIKQLVADYGCYVYMGARNEERGKKAIEELPDDCNGRVELLVVDVSDLKSIQDAAEVLKGKLGDEKLYALVNNAGCGLSHNVTNLAMVTTNYFGTKWMTE